MNIESYIERIGAKKDTMAILASKYNLNRLGNPNNNDPQVYVFKRN
jgi:hypothetical protein